jgi:glycosyltransferase involved in cell wall biosynthesis
MKGLSAYILTYNSQRYLNDILQMVSPICEDVVVLDSGSKDKTEDICTKYSNVNFFKKDFKDFKSQRNYATCLCKNDMVFYLDSDEIPDKDLIEAIIKEQYKGFLFDAYRIKRTWIVMNKRVHCIYPVTCPDYPIRLFNRNYSSFKASSHLVHETISGYRNHSELAGQVLHYTFNSKQEIFAKVEQYTCLAAQDLIDNKRNTNFWKLIFSPIAAFNKWYILKGNIKDGNIGLVLSYYAFLYTRKKYIKARKFKLK